MIGMIGKVAKCKQKLTGLVLGIVKVRDRTLYKGICLDSGRVGQAWQSFTPEWVGTLDEWVSIRHGEIVVQERAVTSAAIAKNGSYEKH